MGTVFWDNLYVSIFYLNNIHAFKVAQHVISLSIFSLLVEYLSLALLMTDHPKNKEQIIIIVIDE